MFKNLSLIRKTSIAFMALLFVSVSLLGSFWIHQEYQAFEAQAGRMRKRFLKNKDLNLQVEVDKALSYISYHRVAARDRVKEDIKERAEQARKLSQDVLDRYQGKLPDLYIKNMIVETLRSMRFMGGLGYYFILDGDANVVLHPGIPGLEGKNIWDWRDAEGHYTVREMMEVVRKKGEGYHRYLWAKPGGDPSEHEKVAYLLLFKPFNWMIGVGEYLNESIRKTKQSALEGLARLGNRHEEYVFVGDWDGGALLGPAKGMNVLKAADANSRKVAGLLIGKSRGGGGFVEYLVPDEGGKTLRRKRSYVRPLPEWKWFVGAGYMVDEVDQLIAKRHAALKAKVRDKLVNITILLLASLAALMALARLLSRRVGKQFEVFQSFFQKAATEMQPIDLARLEGREFRDLAQAANLMVAERSRLEKEKRRMERQLLQSQKMEALGTLAGGIAHDFNNILASVMGYTELAMQKRKNGEDVERDLAQVLKSAERAKALVRQILTFSRKMEPELKPLDLNREILHHIDLLKSLMPKMVSMETRLADDLRLVMGDANQLEQVMVNLFTNANDAMPGGGSLLVETANAPPEDLKELGDAVNPDSAYVRIRVADSGQGMDASTMERIFEPFFTTKEVGKGTGLGLSTVFGIIKGHGGHLTCQSEPGKGSVFTVYLRAVSRARTEYIEEKVSQAEPAGGGGRHVLVVDDETAFLAVLKEALGSGGYRVSTACSGEEALDLYGEQAREIDLVLMDVGMPGMGGHRCLAEMKKINPEARVIISSGYAPDSQEREALELGAAAFIAKPYNLADLDRTIRKVLGGKG